jgi:hypothetical protein
MLDVSLAFLMAPASSRVEGTEQRQKRIILFQSNNDDASGKSGASSAILPAWAIVLLVGSPNGSNKDDLQLYAIH